MPAGSYAKLGGSPIIDIQLGTTESNNWTKKTKIDNND